jgi:site-specific recombinase
MDNFPSLRFSNAIENFREHGDALVLFTEIYGVIRPRKGSDIEKATENHLALLELLENDADKHQLVRKAFAELISSRRLVSFLADSGILPPTGFFSELMRIISHRALPEIPDPKEFRDCVHIILNRQDDWFWLGHIPVENSLRFWRLLTPDDELGRENQLKVFDQILEAMLVLAYRISGLDLDQELRRLGDSLSGYSAAFRAVAGEAQRFADAWRSAAENGKVPDEDERHLLVLIDQCQKVIDKAHRMAMRVGTSLSLTFSLRRATQSLRRLEMLTTLLGSHWRESTRDEAITGWATLVRRAVRAENQRNSLSQHVSRGMSLLALRVTDNAAKSGEHYVTETRSAYFSMWRHPGAIENIHLETRSGTDRLRLSLQHDLRPRLRAHLHAAPDHCHQAAGDDGTDHRRLSW